MNKITTLLIYFFATFFFASMLPGQDRAVMERMRERLPQIDALLTSHVVGENNKGLLHARGDLTDPQKAMIEAENRDRQAVYVVIARRTESTPELVAQQRALQIRERAAAGVWLQDPEGKWYQQPSKP